MTIQRETQALAAAVIPWGPDAVMEAARLAAEAVIRPAVEAAHAEYVRTCADDFQAAARRFYDYPCPARRHREVAEADARQNLLAWPSTILKLTPELEAEAAKAALDAALACGVTDGMLFCVTTPSQEALAARR